MCVSYNTCLLVYFLKRDRYVYSYLAKIKRGSRNKTDEQQYTTNSIYNDIGVRFCVLMDAVIVLCVALCVCMLRYTHLFHFLYSLRMNIKYYF